MEHIENLRASSWTNVLGRRLQYLGGSPVDALSQGIELEPLPLWIQVVCDELVERGVFPKDKPPNHCLLNDYRPGQGIEAHKDGPLYLPRVAVLSLGSHATLQFSADEAEQGLLASLLLPPRGLLVFAGEAYRQHLHSVVAAVSDDLELPGLVRLGDAHSAPVTTPHAERFLPRARRLSLTLRRVRRWWE